MGGSHQPGPVPQKMPGPTQQPMACLCSDQQGCRGAVGRGATQNYSQDTAPLQPPQRVPESDRGPASAVAEAQAKGVLATTVHVTSDPGEAPLEREALAWSNLASDSGHNVLLRRPLLSQESRTVRPQRPVPPTRPGASSSSCRTPTRSSGLRPLSDADRGTFPSRFKTALACAQRSGKNVGEAETVVRGL